MIIKSISNYKHFRTGATYNSKVPSFGYTRDEIMLAKKYMYVKNPNELIREEIKREKYIAWIGDVQELIEKAHKRNSDRVEKIETMDKFLEEKNSQINSLYKKKKRLSLEIEETEEITEAEKQKLSAILHREKRKNYIISKLKESYFNLHKLDKKIYPSGILIKNVNNIFSRRYIINYLRRTDPNFMHIDFDKVSPKNLVKEIVKYKEKALNTEGHSLLCIENFKKYTVFSLRNFRFINKLKGFLSMCADGGKLTLLIFENHPEELENAVIKGHRFGVVIDANAFSNVKTEYKLSLKKHSDSAKPVLIEKIRSGHTLIKNIKNIYETNFLINSLRKYYSNFMYLDFNKVPLESSLNIIPVIKDITQRKEKRLVLCIKNLGKYTTLTPENYYYASRIKGFLSRYADKGILTLLILENHPENLDESIYNNHRFKNIISANEIFDKKIVRTKDKLSKRG